MIDNQQSHGRRSGDRRQGTGCRRRSERSRDNAVEGRVREAAGRPRTFTVKPRIAFAMPPMMAYEVAEEAFDRGRRTLREGHERSVEWPHTSLVVAGLIGFGLGLLVPRTQLSERRVRFRNVRSDLRRRALRRPVGIGRPAFLSHPFSQTSLDLE